MVLELRNKDNELKEKLKMIELKKELLLRGYTIKDIALELGESLSYINHAIIGRNKSDRAQKIIVYLNEILQKEIKYEMV